MNRIKFPCCSRCKMNYHIGEDIYGPKIPMLLNCGHDMCRNCVKFLFRKPKQINCAICQAIVKSTFDDQAFNNIQIHYYLIGKVWCLSTSKQYEIYRHMTNLRMTNSPCGVSKKLKKTCDKCDKFAYYFCNQCNEVYCKNCHKMIHTQDRLMVQHTVETLNNTDPSLHFEKPNCVKHSKLSIDFICVTCELKMCSLCAIEDHRQHDVQYLENYNLFTVQHLKKYLTKGEYLLGMLKHLRDEYRVKMQNYQGKRFKEKSVNFDTCRLTVSTFVCSAIGFLQITERSLMNALDQAETASVTSLNNVVKQLDGFATDLQEKLNMMNLLMENNQLSSDKMTDIVTDIKRMLETSYCVGKKNVVKPLVKVNNSVYEFLKDCIVTTVDDSDIYILKESSVLPLGYTLSSMVNVNSMECTSSVLPENCSTLSVSSNSAISNVFSTEFAKPLSFDYSLIKELIKNRVEPVIITHVNSPSDFYLQLYENESMITTIANELSRFAQLNSSNVEFITKDNVMYAIQNSLNEWRRVIVVHEFEENCEKYYTVHCIDYGDTETVMGNRIKHVPDNIALIPPLAYNCALYELKPSTTTGWSNEAYKLFNELILTKFGSFFVYPIITDIVPIEVDVVWKEYIYPLSIRDSMFFLGYGSGSSEFYVNNSLHENILNTIVMPEPCELEEGVEHIVSLCHFNSPYEFYLRIDDKTDDLNNIMVLLDKIYKSTEIHTHKSYLLYTPQIGLPVAARYTIDGSWYRAKITSLPEPRMVTVFYVDYGNSETLQWDQLRVLDRRLIQIPPLAIKSKLADINPAVEGLECSNWNDKACATFINLLEANSNIVNNLTAVFYYDTINSNTYKVVLYNHMSRGKICINRKLISLGHASTIDPGNCVFQKPNIRKPSTMLASIKSNSRSPQVEKEPDMLAFINQRSVIINEHTWNEANKKNTPGVPMTVINIVSPDEITLKLLDHNSTKLTERINKAYTDKIKQKTKKSDWKTNDLCAMFIENFSNWYRGKIIKVDTVKKTASVYFYDINETYTDIHVKKLYVLEQTFVEEKCGIIHCCMDKLIPLGVSDKKWSKFSCDRLIEKLTKYPYVYFAKKGRRNDIDLGEIWVKDIITSHALKPTREHWTNVNRFMIEQGFALSDKKNKMNDEQHDSCKESESEEFSNVFDTLRCSESMISNWLPPVPITKTQFNAIPTYVDMQCQVYLQNIDDSSENIQQLLYISNKLNCIFADSKPELSNYKWTEGQMVIVRFHLDNMWYRGTILEKKNDQTYSVQFLDYGNIENCSHDDLRLATLDMTNIPQLCVKAFLMNISPLTKNGKWTISTLDFIHSLIVEKPCVVTVDMKMFPDNVYQIRHMKNEFQSDIVQYLVSTNYVHFNHVDKINLNLLENADLSETNELLGDIVDKEIHCDISSNTSYCTFEEDVDAVEVIQNEYEINYRVPSVDSAEERIDDASDYYDAFKMEVDSCNAVEQENDYMKFCLNSNEVIEGLLCNVMGPTRMTLIVKKIDGYDLDPKKDEMQSEINNKCNRLPELTEIVPGTPVLVLYNVFWRRGKIIDDGKSVFLVDLGISIKLYKNNLRLCPPEFFKLPMFSIDCQLVNVKPNENANANEIVEKIWKLLRNVKLKIVGVGSLAKFNMNKDVVDVELYNDKDEKAYQSLIDSQLLVPIK